MPVNIKQFYDSNTHSDSDYPGSRRATSTPDEKPCRACSDFKSWFKSKSVGERFDFMLNAIRIL